MTSRFDESICESLASELEADLLKLYGPNMFGKSLYIALGYGSGEAFRQAVSRKTVPIPVFSIDKRKGKFALTKDVARWSAKQRLERVINEEEVE
ncbi:hypothetical protein [Pseudoalteromonas maricaloris]|uniref:hypothetical protein n=1 Tax=Pseudoalteromonas maricaloris TaxID=184924 RepID=UPI00166011B8|nr:hypothetical protein [Pseudoalteromonas flavipulchra]